MKSNYIELLREYGASANKVKNLWDEIYVNYSKSNRHYYNLNHLENLYSELSTVKNQITNWNVILFTLYYHDIIYTSTKKDNEERSAELASKRMSEIGISEIEVKQCYEQIIATKDHKESPSADANYFLDADLSILGNEPKTYKKYFGNIRKEYSIYPKFIYNKGRKKVINQFLKMNRIFKTEEFYLKYEFKAKFILENELKTL